MNKTTSLSAAVAMTVLLLAGCASAGPVAGSPEPEPTVTVTVTPEPVAVPDFGFTFFHGAQIGSTWTQMSAQLHTPVGGDDGCPWYGPLWSTALSLTYAFTNSTNPGQGSSFFYTNKFLAPDNASFPRNAEGVGVGSTKAEILAAYPAAVVDSYTDLGAGEMTRITVPDPSSDSKYVFAISNGSAVVDLLEWGPGAGSQWSHLCTGF